MSADFQIDINGRQRTLGRISATPIVGQFAISSLDGAFAIIDIVRLERLNITLVERLNGYVGAGFSYSSGTDARQLSAREAASYVTARNKLFQYASVIMSDAGEKRLDIDRLETGLGDFFAFSDRWLGLQYFQYQEIPAVGVESRLTSITAAGMRITHNRVMDLALLSGIAFQRETTVGESARGTETELPLIMDWELGIPRYETRLSAVAIVYQGLSETGRQRFDLRLNLDHELFNNFTIGLHYLYNYDTEPLNPADEKSSTTATFQAGYSF